MTIRQFLTRTLLSTFFLGLLLGCSKGNSDDAAGDSDDKGSSTDSAGADSNGSDSNHTDSTAYPGDSEDNDADGGDSDEPHHASQYAELWYASGETLVYIDLNEADGTVGEMVTSQLTGLNTGQNSLTMLDDGSLVGARITSANDGYVSQFYYIKTPPRDGRDVTPVILGIMPDNIGLEALYTDCAGRLYGMDTGVDDGGSEGNRLIRFTGDYLTGDFEYVVVSDLSVANVADIDDMGPAIDADGEISDNPGLAIDTGNIYDFDFEEGNGTQVANGGDWGIHALGGALFDDGVARVYILSSTAVLYELYPDTFEISEPLVTGPDTSARFPGHSGLAGPLTNCETGFVGVI